MVTVVISGLLFAGLVAALLVATGADNSIQSFSKEGLNDKYIVATEVDQPNVAKAYTDPATITRAEQIYIQTIADKKAEAKKLNIAYDPSTEQSPIINIPGGTGQSAMTRLNPLAPASQQAIQEYAQTHPDPGLPELKKDTQGYQAVAFYATTSSTPSDGQLSTMQNGTENFTADAQSSNGSSHDILQANGLALTDEGLVQPYLLPGAKTNADEIPVAVTYSEATKLLNLTSLPKTASPQQQLDRIQELYKRAGSATFSACYRNNVSEQQIQSAIGQAADIAKNSGNKDYQKPDLIYGLPAADTCGQATILSDTRTKAEKLADQNQDTFNAMFGQTVNPVQQKFTFHIVGLTPDQNISGMSTTVSGILKNVVGSSLSSAVTVPTAMLDQLPNASQIKSLLFPSGPTAFGFSPTSYFAEFANASDARGFIDNKSCTTGPSGRCATPGKPFGLNAYGSNSIAVQDLRHKFSHFFTLAGLVVVIIALVIMGGTIGRMIADGRRETAVFRAIGAKRIDIAITYTIYTLCLSLYVAIFALVAGVFVAKGFDYHFWKSTTVQAQLLFGASDTSREFHFIAWTSLIWLVLLAALGCGLLGMTLPLLRNARRSPIKDMREE